MVLGVFGVAPGFCLRLIVMAFPRGHDRRKELLAEFYEVPYAKRPLWVASQLEVAVFEGFGSHLAKLANKLKTRRAAVYAVDIVPTNAGRLDLAVGAWFPSRHELATSGLHKQLQAGICGNGARGAESVIVADPYIGDIDRGDEIIYTGCGGLDNLGRHVADQSFESPGNVALLTSHLAGSPVRVIRSAKAKQWGPSAGYRYDGLYLVAKAWSEASGDGPMLCKYLLVRQSGTSNLEY